jgi:hypothetical protein
VRKLTIAGIICVSITAQFIRGETRLVAGVEFSKMEVSISKKALSFRYYDTYVKKVLDILVLTVL